MEGQAAYNLLTCFLRKRQTGNTDLHKELPNLLRKELSDLLNHCCDQGCFQNPCAVHRLYEREKPGDRIQDAPLEDEKVAEKRGKLWWVVHSEIVQCQAEREAVRQVSVVHGGSRESAACGCECPFPPVVSTVRLPASAIGRVTESPRAVAPPTPTASLLPGPGVPLPPSPPASGDGAGGDSRGVTGWGRPEVPYPGSVRVDSISRNRRDVWAAVAKDCLNSGDSEGPDAVTVRELKLDLKETQAAQHQALAAFAPLQAAAAFGPGPPSSGKVKCFRCGDPGHLRRQCQAQGLWCHHCQSSSHNIGACRRWSRSSALNHHSRHTSQRAASVTRQPDLAPQGRAERTKPVAERWRLADTEQSVPSRNIPSPQKPDTSGNFGATPLDETSYCSKSHLHKDTMGLRALLAELRSENLAKDAEIRRLQRIINATRQQLSETTNDPRKQLKEDVLDNRNLQEILQDRTKDMKSQPGETLSPCGDQTSRVSICLREEHHLSLQVSWDFPGEVDKQTTPLDYSESFCRDGHSGRIGMGEYKAEENLFTSLLKEDRTSASEVLHLSKQMKLSLLSCPRGQARLYPWDPADL